MLKTVGCLSPFLQRNKAQTERVCEKQQMFDQYKKLKKQIKRKKVDVNFHDKHKMILLYSFPNLV